MEPTKKDWALFRSKLGGWQEAYMARLNQEYIELLSDETRNASDRFWALAERVKDDRRHPGVSLRLSKQTMIYDMARLYQDGVIQLEDLDEFSEELRAAVQYLSEPQ